MKQGIFITKLCADHGRGCFEIEINTPDMIARRFELTDVDRELPDGAFIITDCNRNGIFIIEPIEPIETN